MADAPNASPSGRDLAERVQVRVMETRGTVARWLERIPSSVRTTLRRAFTIAFFAAVGLVLYRQLSSLDWPAVLRAIPRSPWFYLLFLARYMSLPIADALSYSAVWATNLFRHFGAFLMKRLLNSSFSAGSGDVYLLLWTVRTLGVSYRQAFTAAKDVTLLSAASSNAVAVIILAIYLGFGDLSLMEAVHPGILGAIIGVTMVVAVLSLLVVRFRGKVLGVSAPVMWRVLAYHGLRSGSRLLLLGLQWTVGVPGSSFSDWIGLLIVDLLVSRTPLIPSREFLFLTLALGLADTIEAPHAQVTATLLTDTALMQIGAVVSLLMAILWRSKPQALPENPSPAERDVG